jgi:hypothetical protein
MSEYKVQSIVFQKDKIDSIDEALNWLVEHKYKLNKVDDTGTQLRFRQLQPYYLKSKGYTEYRTKVLNPVISLILVYPPKL